MTLEFFDQIEQVAPFVGAIFFGAVVGWMAHHVFQAAKDKTVEWLGTMIAVIGGGAVTALFDKKGPLFGGYCVGLGLLFFIRVVINPVTNAISRELEILEQEEKVQKLKRAAAKAKKQEAIESANS